VNQKCHNTANIKCPTSNTSETTHMHEQIMIKTLLGMTTNGSIL